MDVDIKYSPQAKQSLLHRSSANEILYGGAAGPGKSHALRFEALIWALRVNGLQVYLFRRTFPELEKNHILPSLEQFPHELGVYKRQDKRWEFYNGSMIHFCHCQHESDVFVYQGAEIHLLVIDELTTFSEFLYDFLRSRVRCTLKIPKQYRHKIPGIVCGTNPGGVGHNFAKERWVDFVAPFECRRAPGPQGGMMRTYIPALLEDNAVLMESDPGYIHRLDALPEPYRTAYKTGNWDIFLGQAFRFSREHHVVRSPVVPENAQVYMTFDWGYGAPFSVGWWFVDADGRVIRFAEWYGWTSTPNQGLRLTDPEIAQGIKEREKTLGLEGRSVTRLAGPDCWNKKPDYRGGGQGPSTSEVFTRFGLYMSPADANRSLKIRQFHERLRIPEDGTRPMLQVSDGCQHFIRTIPLLQADPHNVEDVDTNGEDHVYDEACHVCMARPLRAVEKKPKTMVNARLDALERGGAMDEFEDYMSRQRGRDDEGSEWVN